jgi:hypothetical protein
MRTKARCLERKPNRGTILHFALAAQLLHSTIAEECTKGIHTTSYLRVAKPTVHTLQNNNANKLVGGYLNVSNQQIIEISLFSKQPIIQTIIARCHHSSWMIDQLQTLTLGKVKRNNQL